MFGGSPVGNVMVCADLYLLRNDNRGPRFEAGQRKENRIFCHINIHARLKTSPGPDRREGRLQKDRGGKFHAK
jgi:hypothetical protein